MSMYANQSQADTAPAAPVQALGSSAVSAAGRVFLVPEVLKDLRTSRLQSQEDMAYACTEGRFRVSIATIKRAETGKPVVYRVARELARYFGVPVQQIVRLGNRPTFQ